MTAQIIHDNGRASKIQTPPYACPECGATIPPARILSYARFRSPRAIWKPLDDYAEQVNYLHCPACQVCTRVVRLGDAGLPFDWPHNCNADAEVRTVAEALSFLADHAPAAEHDPAAQIIYRLLSRQITPAYAIEEIHILAEAAINEVMEMVPDVAVPEWSYP